MRGSAAFSAKICEASGEPVTVFNLDGRKGGRRLEELKFPPGKLRIHEKREPYADYVREIAKHKIVLQLDRSRVPGQVAHELQRNGSGKFTLGRPRP